MVKPYVGFFFFFPKMQPSDKQPIPYILYLVVVEIFFIYPLIIIKS
jgi:hypothetical protein